MIVEVLELVEEALDKYDVEEVKQLLTQEKAWLAEQIRINSGAIPVRLYRARYAQGLVLSGEDGPKAPPPPGGAGAKEKSDEADPVHEQAHKRSHTDSVGVSDAPPPPEGGAPAENADLLSGLGVS